MLHSIPAAYMPFAVHDGRTCLANGEIPQNLIDIDIGEVIDMTGGMWEIGMMSRGRRSRHIF